MSKTTRARWAERTQGAAPACTGDPSCARGDHPSASAGDVGNGVRLVEVADEGQRGVRADVANIGIYGGNVAPMASYRPVRDHAGNVTLQPPGDEERRAGAFRREVEHWIAVARDARDPIRIWFDIGPIEAQVLLSFSRGNRREPASTVEMYGRDVESMDWKQHHQGMAFARSGWFGDGHHRAKAVAESGGTIRIAIDFGVADDSFDAVDMLRPRSIPDQLALRDGIKTGAKLVAAVRMCMALTEAKLYAVKRSISEVQTGITEHQKAISALRHLAGTRYPASYWGAMLFAHAAAPSDVEALALNVTHGEGITGAAYVLREYLGRQSGKGEPFVVAQHTLYAARAFIERRPFARFSPRDEHTIVAWFAERRKAG